LGGKRTLGAYIVATDLRFEEKKGEELNRKTKGYGLRL